MAVEIRADQAAPGLRRGQTMIEILADGRVLTRNAVNLISLSSRGAFAKESFRLPQVFEAAGPEGRDFIERELARLSASVQGDEPEDQPSPLTRVVMAIQEEDRYALVRDQREDPLIYDKQARVAFRPAEPMGEGLIRDWWYRITKQIPSTRNVQDAGKALANAARAGDRWTSVSRILREPDRIVVNLGRPDGLIVLITREGWQVLPEAPAGLLCVPGPFQAPMPIPVRGGSLDLLGEFLPHLAIPGIRETILGWILGCFMPTGTFPILQVTAQHGSGKTLTCKILARLIDPRGARHQDQHALRLPDKDVDLFHAVNGKAVALFDNVGMVKPEIADVLCQIASGGARETRKLYTDLESVIFEVHAPLIVTSIGPVTTASDLTSRMIRADLPHIGNGERRGESAIWAEFERRWPAILGAIFDRVSGALASYRAIEIPSMGRLSDLATWGEASRFMNPKGAFADLLLTQEKEQSLMNGDSNPLFQAILEIVSPDGWTGTASQLHRELDRKHAGAKWLHSAQWLGTDLVKFADYFRVFDFEYRKTINKGRATHHIEPIDPAAPALPAAPDPAPAAPALPEPVLVAPGSPGLISTSEDLREVLEGFGISGNLAIDLETTSKFPEAPGKADALSPRRGRIRLVSLASDGAPGIVFDAWAIPDWREILKPVLDDALFVIAHNLKFELSFLAAEGFPIPEDYRLFDTMIAVQLLEASGGPGPDHPAGLGPVAKRYLDLDLDKSNQTSDWGSPVLAPDQIEYSRKDAEVLIPLFNRLIGDLAEAELTNALRIEMKALPAFVWMEAEGVPVDPGRWMTQTGAALIRKSQALDSLRPFGHADKAWDSPAQVLEILRSRGHQIESADEDSLAALDDPMAAAILEYRGQAKSVSTYGPAWLVKHVDPETLRIYPEYGQVLQSGRTSGHNPNFQNLPRGKAYRRAFRASPGHKLVVADYSQIELRIAAEFAPEPRLIEGYQKGIDAHTLTASLILGKPLDSVSKDDRQIAKSLNFGLLYGMGKDRLADYVKNNYGVELTQDEALDFRSRWFVAYPGFREWHRVYPRPTGMETRTLADRRRLNVTSFSEQLNSPIQGTGADILKLALGLLWERRKPGIRLIGEVHDEILLEAPEDQAEEAAWWLAETMEEAGASILELVKAEAEAKIVDDWSEK